MVESKSTRALSPILSSPRWLAFTGFVVLIGVLFIQKTSGIPATTAFSPVELSSNAVAAMGLIWALLQLRTYRHTPLLRGAWAKLAAGMALLAVEGNVGEALMLPTHTPGEMALSITLWVLAAVLLYRGGRVFAPRRSVIATLRLAVCIQVAAQYLGWLGSTELSDVAAAEALEYMNDAGELVAVLSYLFAMLLAEFSPFKSYRFPTSAIGRKAREIVSDFNILERHRYPTRNPWLRQEPVRPFVVAAIALWHLVRVAPRVRKEGGPAIVRQALDLARLGWQGINPHSYYLLELFRRENRRAADEFVTRVETKNGLTRRMQEQVATSSRHVELTDKLKFTRICEANELSVAPIFGAIEAGSATFLTDRQRLDRDLLIKERRGRGGKLTLVYRRVDVLTFQDDAGEIFGIDELVTNLILHFPTHELIIQPKLENHDSVSYLAKDALVVFRVVTCLDASEEPRVTHGLLRIMRRFEPSWPKFPEKEWGAAIELESGMLSALAGDVPTTCTTRYPEHPVNGRSVQGVRLKCWNEIADIAVRAHTVFLGRAIIGWDIALTPEGPCILEGNSNMDFNFMQRCYQTPVGRSPLAELMEPYLDAVLAAEKRPHDATATRR